MSGGIVWLASYPKSGNTWLRIFLANLVSGATRPYDINMLRHFGYSDARASLYERAAGKPLAGLDMAHLHRLRPLVHRLVANLEEDSVFVKTHNAIAVRDGIATITPETTRGAIYVIRNPLDVSLSYAHHFAMRIDDVIAAMASPEHLLATVDRAVFSFLGSWSGHVTSWTEAAGLEAHVVRYEDMLARPLPTFRAVAAYLDLEPDREPGRERIKRAVRFSAFEEVQGQERRHGFAERGPVDNAFFRAGRAEEWRRVLTPAQIDAITGAHGEVMRRHGYLP